MEKNQNNNTIDDCRRRDIALMSESLRYKLLVLPRII